MALLITYDVGFPTRLVGQKYAERMFREHGRPVRLTHLAGLIRIEFAPIYPGVPDPECVVYEPWKDGRRVVDVRIEP